jgi:hypothetical protein
MARASSGRRPVSAIWDNAAASRTSAATTLTQTGRPIVATIPHGFPGRAYSVRAESFSFVVPVKARGRVGCTGSADIVARRATNLSSASLPGARFRHRRAGRLPRRIQDKRWRPSRRHHLPSAGRHFCRATPGGIEPLTKADAPAEHRTEIRSEGALSDVFLR